MSRTAKGLVERIKEGLNQKSFLYEFNEEENTLRISQKNRKEGLTLSLGGLVAKWERSGEETISTLIEHIKKSFDAMNIDVSPDLLNGKILPVIRATSFPTVSREGEEFLVEEHTAETRIYYSIDLGESYRLLTIPLLKQLGWDIEDVKSKAMNRMFKLPISIKEDEVAGNQFYFLRTNDGYDGSRILNSTLLNDYFSKKKGELLVGVPHQDVLILADIQNEKGYDIMAQVMMQFFMNGRVPITSLSFSYNGKELEPIFILGKKK